MVRLSPLTTHLFSYEMSIIQQEDQGINHRKIGRKHLSGNAVFYSIAHSLFLIDTTFSRHSMVKASIASPIRLYENVPFSRKNPNKTNLISKGQLPPVTSTTTLPMKQNSLGRKVIQHPPQSHFIIGRFFN